MHLKRKLEDPRIEGRKERVQSSWIANFLSQKRDLSIRPAPEVELTKDTYLRKFSEEFLSHPTQKDEKISENYLADDSYLGEFNMRFLDTTAVDVNNNDVNDNEGDDFASHDIDISVLVRNNSEGDVEASVSVEEKEGISTNNGKLRLFNLPYDLNPTDVINIALMHKIEFLSVILAIDSRTSLPSGQASVELAPHVNELNAIEVIGT